MILDKLLQFDPAATALTVTAPSTNVIDLVNAREMSVDVGPAQLAAVVTVGTALTSAGATTLTVQYQQSTDNAAWTIAAQTDAIPKANLTAGMFIVVNMPPMQPQSAGIPRYHRLNYVVATGPFTGGNIEADLVMNRHVNSPQLNYPAGITVAN
jgi:Bbp16-like protein